MFGKPKSYDITVDTQKGNKINKENQRDKKKNRLKLIEATQAERCNGEKKYIKKKTKTIFALNFYALLIRLRTSASVGRAGIAPFLVVVIAPHAFANLSTSLNLASSSSID